MISRSSGDNVEVLHLAVAGKEIDHVLELIPGRCFARNLEATAVKAGSVLIFLLVCAGTKVIHSELSGCADGLEIIP
jgi:hypothetical protein